jgi:hypothetical protein
MALTLFILHASKRAGCSDPVIDLAMAGLPKECWHGAYTLLHHALT